MNTGFSKAMDTVVKTLKEDAEVRLGWESNLSMAFQDAAFDALSHDERKRIGDKAAGLFLERLTGFR